jgi:hypothetical protein
MCCSSGPHASLASATNKVARSMRGCMRPKLLAPEAGKQLHPPFQFIVHASPHVLNLALAYAPRPTVAGQPAPTTKIAPGKWE